MSPARRSFVRIVMLGCALLPGASGCAPAAGESMGDTPAAARTNTKDLFHALAYRLGPLTRSDRLKQIRPRYVRGSLIPSRIFDDTSIWTGARGSTRTLEIAGHPTPDGRYLLDVVPDAAAPQAVGESRHLMHLRELGDGAWEWRSTDELAVGDATPSAIDTTRRRLLGAAEGRSGAGPRALWQRALPRTTGALGRLFAVDSITTIVLADRTTSVALRISTDPSRLGGALPEFGKWVAKYRGNSRYRMVIDDGAGVPFAFVSAADGVIHVRLRTRDGILQPLNGPARAIAPDSLRMRADVSTKLMVFTVGVRALTADIVPVRTTTERGWIIRYRHEPDWRFPLAADHLLRDALRRPFSGEGTWTRLVARRDASGSTLIVRDFHMEVQESAIVRWLSALGNSAMSDVTARVEQEKDRFFADALAAFGDDLASHVGGPDGGPAAAR